jgi:hypothetical protein
MFTSICLWLAPSSWAQLQFNSGTTVLFATIEQAGEILTNRDDFLERLSPFDRAARMKTDKSVSEKEFVEFVARNILDWNEREKQKLTSALQGIHRQFELFSLPLPKKVLLIKTSGDEEGNAAYTRANGIILPQGDINGSLPKIQKSICHELFHIVSRTNPDLRDKLYGSIGFVKCDEVEFPVDLKLRKITNPDAPINNHRILVKIDGKDEWTIPILFSSAEKYNTARGGEFFDYLQFKFLIVKRQGVFPDVKPAYEGGKARLVGVEEISGFHEQVGKNTNYIIHPEEILADNFALLILDRENARSPKIIQGMEDILRENKGK